MGGEALKRKYSNSIMNSELEYLNRTQKALIIKENIDIWNTLKLKKNSIDHMLTLREWTK